MEKGLRDKYQITKKADGKVLEEIFVPRLTKDPLAWLIVFLYARLTKNGKMSLELEEYLNTIVGRYKTGEDNFLGEEGLRNKIYLELIQHQNLDRWITRVAGITKNILNKLESLEASIDNNGCISIIKDPMRYVLKKEPDCYKVMIKDEKTNPPRKIGIVINDADLINAPNGEEVQYFTFKKDEPYKRVI